MTNSISELLDVNLHQVFGVRNERQRVLTIAQYYAEDVRFTDPGGTVVGREALNAKARDLLADAPGFVFVPVGPKREAGDEGSLSWSFGPEGAAPVVSGTDTITVRDGLIASLHTALSPS